ncbi:MAG: biotin transporter BioY [Rhabdochlamydiaceae bacterium]
MFTLVFMERKITHTFVFNRELLWMGAALFGAALITLGSMMRVPLYPVSFTLQTLAVFFVGLTQTPKQAAASGVCYLLCASAGLPVLGGHANPLWLVKKCGGFLLAFPIGAYLIARLRKRPLLALLCGSAVIFTLGWIWLAYFFGAKVALMQGVLIFLPSEALKIILAWRVFK